MERACQCPSWCSVWRLSCRNTPSLGEREGATGEIFRGGGAGTEGGGWGAGGAFELSTLGKEVIPIMRYVIIHTMCSGVRPFGVSLLVVGYDEDEPYLYQCDPSVR